MIKLLRNTAMFVAVLVIVALASVAGRWVLYVLGPLWVLVGLYALIERRRRTQFSSFRSPDTVIYGVRPKKWVPNPSYPQTHFRALDNDE